MTGPYTKEVGKMIKPMVKEVTYHYKHPDILGNGTKIKKKGMVSKRGLMGQHMKDNFNKDKNTAEALYN